MFPTRFIGLCLALVCAVGLCSPAMALEVESDATYCFCTEDFDSEMQLAGICIMELPDSSTGTVFLGSRVLQPGDILTAEQMSQMTFGALATEVDRDAVVTYLPIYENRVEPSTTMTISIRGKKNQAPAAEDLALETYKNLPNEGVLKASDPEGQTLTYTVIRQPRRGEVTVSGDGKFVYTPKKNKVGVDSFTYTATDPAGNVSREATVTVQILKPTDSKKYADTVGRECRFAAEWMRNTGLFVGEKINGETCFQPDKAVSRGEFVAMLVNLLDIPTQEASYTGIAADAPDWLKPYLAAAVRSGLIANTPAAESGVFDPYAPIPGEEAAVMIQNVLALDVQTVAGSDGEEPTWEETCLQAMSQNGISLTAGDPLDRGESAQLLYRVSQLAADAPGMVPLRLQK